jgi:hypothetical protein
VRPRLSQTAAWQALEADRWQRTGAGDDLGPRGVRLDRPTPSGDPPPTEEGLRPEGPRKDHRPDRPQGTVRAAAAEPAGPGLAGDVPRGQAADDPLSRPLVARVRQLVGRSGRRDVGDGTRVAWATRADLGAPAAADLLAWRLLTWLETPVRQGLARTGKPLAGWDAGQLGRTTDRPTGVRLLNAGARAEIPRTRLPLGQRHRWHLTPLPQVRAQVLASLGLSPSR